MAKTLRLRTFSDARGNLSVVEDYEIPFKIKRLFYIYDLNPLCYYFYQHSYRMRELLKEQSIAGI